MTDKLLIEKLKWEAEAEHGSDEPEHEYDPEKRMDALEVLLASIDHTVNLIDRYAKASPEEKDVAIEAGELKRNLEEYSQIFQRLYREAEQEVIEGGQ